MKHDIVLIENQFLKLNKAQKKLILTQKQIDAFLDLIHGPGYTTPAEHFMLLNSINFALKLTEQLNAQNRIILEASAMIPN